MAPMAQLDEQFVGPLEGAAVDGVLREALGHGNGSAVPEPEPFVCTDGPVVSTRFRNTEGTWVLSGGVCGRPDFIRR
jgi:hypothetical protein